MAALDCPFRQRRVQVNIAARSTDPIVAACAGRCGQRWSVSTAVLTARVGTATGGRSGQQLRRFGVSMALTTAQAMAECGRRLSTVECISVAYVGGDGGDALEAVDLDTDAAVAGGSAIAERTLGVGTPGVDGAVAAHGISVVEAGGDGGDAVQAADPYWGAPFGGGAVADLPEVVPTPREDGAVAAQGISVVFAGGDGGDAVQAADPYRGAAVGRGAVAEIAVRVGPPGGDGAVAAQGISVEVSAGDGGDAGQAADPYRGEPVDGGAVAELAVGVPTPRVDRAVAAQGMTAVCAGG